jgi:transposase InsO family protein
MAQENQSWGYDRIVGALANLGYRVSDNTVGNILKRNGLAPAPERKKTTTWKEFIRTHRDLLFGTDFFTAKVWTLNGLVTFYVFFFIRVSSREIHIAGITPHPNEGWISQIARNVTMEGVGLLKSGDFVIHDRDRKFCALFQRIIESVGIRRIALPARSPDLNAFRRDGSDLSKKTVYRESFFSEKVPFGARLANMWNITIGSETTRAGTMYCFSLRRKQVTKKWVRFNVEKGWVAF